MQKETILEPRGPPILVKKGTAAAQTRQKTHAIQRRRPSTRSRQSPFPNVLRTGKEKEKARGNRRHCHDKDKTNTFCSVTELTTTPRHLHPRAWRRQSHSPTLLRTFLKLACLLSNKETLHPWPQTCS